MNPNLLPNFLLFTVLFLACSPPQKVSSSGNIPEAGYKKLTVTIDPSRQYQEMDNFGASDAWACQFVGQWPDAKKNAIADLLFSMDTTAMGAPRGIGLSLWRFNIGAGSADQGDSSEIKDEWRRAESFLLANGQYNWEQQAGQQWFLQAARERGVQQFLAFPNSPPVYLTKNGKAFASDGQSNLAPESYDAFADYLARVVKGVADQTGIQFQYLSPVNEPQWDWSNGNQEGTPFRNDEIAGIARAINARFEAENLSTHIDVAEAGKINYLYTIADKPQRGQQIQTFFTEGSPNYIGDLSRVGKAVSGHSYFTTSPEQKAIGMREEVAQAVAAVPGLKYWMSEYCILGGNEGEIKGNGRDLGMTSALYMARVIHHDLTVAQASAWQWWLAVSPYDYKDGLVYIDKNKADGNFYDSKMLWALGNYSRFIRPGAVRIEAITSTSTPPVYISAYFHPETQQITTVIINNSKEDYELKLKVKDNPLAYLRAYITDTDQNLQPTLPISGEQTLTVPFQSVTTLVGKIP